MFGSYDNQYLHTNKYIGGSVVEHRHISYYEKAACEHFLKREIRKIEICNKQTFSLCLYQEEIVYTMQ